MKKLIFLFITAGFLLMLTACSEKKPVSNGLSTAEPATERGSDISRFVADYRAFVNRYCQLTSEMKGASLSEKSKLIQKLAPEGEKMNRYADRIDKIRANASGDVETELQSLQQRAEACSKTAIQ